MYLVVSCISNIHLCPRRIKFYISSQVACLICCTVTPNIDSCWNIKSWRKCIFNNFWICSCSNKHFWSIIIKCYSLWGTGSSIYRLYLRKTCSRNIKSGSKIVLNYFIISLSKCVHLCTIIIKSQSSRIKFFSYICWRCKTTFMSTSWWIKRSWKRIFMNSSSRTLSGNKHFCSIIIKCYRIRWALLRAYRSFANKCWSCICFIK